MGGQGAKVGPQLDGVGARGLARLLEDVLDPNRNVDQAFRSMVLSLQSGQVASGLLLREEGDVLVIADNEGKEQRYLKEEVEERKLSNVSPMPAGFGEKLSERELADLMAYLLKSAVTPTPAGEEKR
jgi:putative heme-binding domain-containing protein